MERVYGTTTLRNKTFEKTPNNPMNARTIKDLFKRFVTWRYFTMGVGGSVITELEYVFQRIWDQTRTIYSCFPKLLHGLSIAVNPIRFDYFKKRLKSRVGIFESSSEENTQSKYTWSKHKPDFWFQTYQSSFSLSLGADCQIVKFL